MTLNLRSSTHGSHSLQVGEHEDISKLRTLRTLWDLPIDKLDGEDKKNFMEVFNKVRALFNHPDKYNEFHDEIRAEFVAGDDKRQVVPGTVGAYFAGCLVNSDGCSAMCAGSAPLPRGQQFCDAHVFFADYDASADIFTFRRVFGAPDVIDRAILYVKSNNLDEFQGFNQSEKSALEDFNVRFIKLMQTGDEPRQIMNDYLPLVEIKSRAGTARAVSCTTYNGWAIFGLFLIIIIIGIIIWLMVRESRQSKA